MAGELGQQQPVLRDDHGVGRDPLVRVDPHPLGVGQPRALGSQRRLDRLGGLHDVPQHEVAEHTVDGLDRAAPAAGGQLHRRVLPVPERQARDDAPVVAAEDGDHATRAPARRYSASVAASTPLQSCAGGVSSR